MVDPFSLLVLGVSLIAEVLDSLGDAAVDSASSFADASSDFSSSGGNAGAVPNTPEANFWRDMPKNPDGI